MNRGLPSSLSPSWACLALLPILLHEWVCRKPLTRVKEALVWGRKMTKRRLNMRKIRYVDGWRGGEQSWSNYSPDCVNFTGATSASMVIKIYPSTLPSSAEMVEVWRSEPLFRAVHDPMDRVGIDGRKQFHHHLRIRYAKSHMLLVASWQQCCFSQSRVKTAHMSSCMQILR